MHPLREERKYTFLALPFNGLKNGWMHFAIRFDNGHSVFRAGLSSKSADCYVWWLFSISLSVQYNPVSKLALQTNSSSITNEMALGSLTSILHL